jgi:hypothetical protein
LIDLFLKFLEIRLWWAHVTEIPDDNRITVFNKGMFIGSNILIPFGGHIIPSSGVGESLLPKNAQKNEKKNNTSDRINKIIPVFNPSITRLL